ncbi:MAG: error-prone DNA polymerase [Bryobacteraceae bacterium]|nr:error-prone DNA polymerase [Bryobacteraceae bacterium]
MGTMYAELHTRSAFSFLEGASTPEDLVETAARLDLPALALADTDNLSGAPRFYMAARKAGLKAHLGAEITAAAGGRFTLFAESRTGYQNLCRLLSTMKLRAPKGQGAATLDDFRQYAPGLVCLTHGERDPKLLLDLYGRGQVYAELRRDFRRSSEARNQRVLAMAQKHQLPLLATNGVRYAQPDRRELMDVLTCVRHKTTVAQAGRLLEANAQRYLKPEHMMRRLFADYPEAIDQTQALSERLTFTLADLGYQFPLYPLPPGETIDSFLRQRTEEGARQRYRPYHEKAQRQIERELQLIAKLALGGYFLIVWDIVRFCREQGILAQGRGSAANSAVCYSLGITAVDPVGMDLLFERFLSEERGEWPDIDIDLPSGDQRERVIQYVYQRYGQHGAAMTANVITYRGRSGIRDVGKALGYDKESLDPIASLVSRWGFEKPGDPVERPFEEAGQKMSDPRTAKFVQLYREIQDLPRHLGQHSGGMVISQHALSSVVPLEPATMPGRVIIQWDKEDCADLGLIKVDLLGLGMMAALEESIELIRTAHGDEIDLSQLPADDPKVYAMLQRADTVGLFQVESRAQMSSLPLTKPEKFYDLVVQVAIIRPGPIVGKMYHPFVRRRRGLEAPVSLHPSLDGVLARTLGVPLFQEQLLRMAMIVANFTGGEAEELRRAMGFKRSEKRMLDIETRLRAGMTANGIDAASQEKIVQSITSFALYGFPESHAASFALLAYASAWLRTYYPAAFTAALLNQQPMGFYHPATLVKDAQRHGVRVLPVDITKSDWRCNIEDGALRLGLNYSRGLRADVAQLIVKARPFLSIVDLTRRVPELRKDEVRQLASIGALNALEDTHRRDALWQTELALQPTGPLLAHLEPANGKSPLRAMTIGERLTADFAGTSMTVGQHPVAHHRTELNKLRVWRAADLAQARHNTIVRIAGCVICRQRPSTAKGFAFFSLEDETGISNAIVAPDFFDQHRLTLISEPYLLMEGVLQNQGGAISVKVGRVQPLHLGQALMQSHDFH